MFTRATPYLDPQVGAGVLLAGANGRDRSWLLRGGFQPATGTSWEGMQWAAFSPDGSQVVFVVAERTPLPPDGYRLGPNVHVVAVDGTNPRLLAYGADRPVFSPDGTRIAYLVHGAMGTEGTAVETVDADGTDRRTLVAPHRYITRVDFAPDGKRLVAVESGRGIVIVNAQTGERTRLHRRVLGPVADAVWSPDGRRIAYAVYDRHSESDLATKPHVYVIRPDGTGKRLAFTARVPDIGMLAWQPLP